MKLNIKLTDKEKAALHQAKLQKDIPDERVTMILLAGEGMKADQIAPIVGTNAQTVRRHLKSYILDSIEGLSRAFSAGRPSKRNEQLIPFLTKILKEDPSEYGYQKSTWDSPMIIELFHKDKNETVSHDTVSRAMKDMGYSYKKPQKSPSIKAPSKKEKTKVIGDAISFIKKKMENEELEVFCLDESHFTNEPYLIRGYFKKGRENKNSDSCETRNKKPIWCIESEKWRFLLEEL
ncbi:putative integrase protein [Lentisphaera araneosa HTCC2155]|uniref:Putative integrase protein n=1 Tax=Lentisphaera araneosa HTCC2155 TaxID=313628 RepID=A6DRG4_9BACT|nr:IS630 family transposase [Lentisphaera araneosa]EDM25774.1 putative integrase protein [Lentisphaera araneosa HTCC2155]